MGGMGVSHKLISCWGCSDSMLELLALLSVSASCSRAPREAADDSSSA